MPEDLATGPTVPAPDLGHLLSLLSEGALLPIVTMGEDGPWRVVAMVPSDDLRALGRRLADGVAPLGGWIAATPVEFEVHTGSFAQSQRFERVDRGDGRSWTFDLTMVREDLVADMVPALDQLDPVPHATVEQARRLAALKTRLLESKAYTFRALAQGWDVAVPTARKRVDRARARDAVFTVVHDGEVLLPAFLLDGQMGIRSELAEAIRALRSAGEDGWATWAWFTSPSAWLDGSVPEELAASDPDAVATAARRRASNGA